jgi:hypothetical protein
MGKLLIIAGCLLIAAGVLLTIVGKVPFLGRLPGDIRIEKEGFSFYFPLTTCILISLLLSFLVWLFRR